MPGNIQKRRQQAPNGVCCLLVQVEGLETPTGRLEGGYSIRLSYTCKGNSGHSVPRIWRKMEDSNPQENIAALHVGFLDRCANHYANLPYLVGATGLEPATTRLKVGDSTN